jgi:hypothetical protein
VASNTSLTLDATPTAYTDGWSGKKYTITDPLDLDVAVYDAFLRLCEKHAAHMLDLKDKRGIAATAADAMALAKGGDARIKQRRVAGMSAPIGTRLAHTDRSSRVEV